MAGIGFELKKLFNKKGYFNNIKAYLYTAFVTVGPTILCMTIIIFLQLFLIYMGIGVKDRELTLAAITYSFIFSLVLTSGFSMVITRYISDKLYTREYQDILPSFYGISSLCLILGGIIGVVFYLLSPLKWDFKLAAYVLYMQMIIIWLISVYLTALKDYMKIVGSFFWGVAISLIMIIVLVMLAKLDAKLSCLISIDIGNFIIIISLTLHLMKFFEAPKTGYFKFISYFDKYYGLFFISFAYTLGIYIHNFVFWFSKHKAIAGQTYVFCPLYDVPAFYAFITIITAMVIFVASVETAFYEKYKQYYTAIIGIGTLEDIRRTKKELENVMLQEITYVMELQLFFTLIFMVLGIKLLPTIGFTRLQVDIFNIMTLGSFACIIMFIIILLLLYFDDRKGALISSSVFLMTNLLFTIWTLKRGEDFYGFGFFLSSIISLFTSLILLWIFVKNLDYYTFCSQPVIYREIEGPFTKLVKIIYK